MVAMAARVAKAVQVVGDVKVALVVRVDQGADPVDLVAASASFSARRRSASFVSRRWT
jgi:hypothetical protein